MKAHQSSSVIIGIDPGSRVTGFGVLHCQATGDLRHIQSGVFRMSSAGNHLYDRLPILYAHMTKLLTSICGEYGKVVAAVESVFTKINPSSALKLGHARGVIVLALKEASCPLFEYAPRTVKQAVTGHGGAQKDHIQKLIRYQLGLSSTPTEDEADALAVAMCHAAHGHFSDCLKRS